MKLLLRIYAYVIAIFMLSPLILIVWMSFTPDEYFALPFHDFTLR
jgi:ABC-type spermidine/putrescine transport system permease subunit II